MNLELFHSLREKYPVFTYESYNVEKLEGKISCKFYYKMQGTHQIVSFLHEVIFSVNKNHADLSSPLFLRTVFLLGLAETVNYWKLACPKTVNIVPGCLNDEDILFWEKLFTHGLGEFYWLNGIYGNIAEGDYVHFISAGESEYNPITLDVSGCMVPVGGGKDSVVTLELLHTLGNTPDIVPLSVFFLSAREASYATAKIAGYSEQDYIEAFRVFDPQMLKMNHEGYLNGHVPYSAILGFTAVVSAVLYKKKYIVLSNEGSANEPTVPGTWVNHQYSKSLEFELDFSGYLQKSITPSIFYFSLLRPWSEARIAMVFSEHPKYHAAFRSCNKGSKDNVWCCHCSKCLFVYILLGAQAGIESTTKVFGENLLLKDSLLPILEELTGMVPVKPFECIGTIEETRWSLYQILKSEPGFYEEQILPSENAVKRNQLFQDILHDSSQAAFRLIDSELSANIPSFFLPAVFPQYGKLKQMLKNEKIGILGFGLEGKSTLQVLNQVMPSSHYIIADQKEQAITDAERNDSVNSSFFSGDHFAESCISCSLVFKSPGIPLKKIDRILTKQQITCQTEIFLSLLGNRTVGITGTKGKSTTASLLQKGLQSRGIDAVLIGNIGKPAFDVLAEDVPKRIYVYELSSHMLETVTHSPHWGVFLNLYEEHLDHYRSFDHYARAKGNLVKFQSPLDICLVGEDVPEYLFDDTEATISKLSFYDGGSLLLPIFDSIDSSDVHNELPDEKTTYPFLIPNDNPYHISRVSVNGKEHIQIPEDAFVNRKLAGRHNLHNIQMALYMIHTIQPFINAIDLGIAIQELNRFSGLKHRLEYIGFHGSIHFYNDSISTVPETLIAAVQSLGTVETLIFGGLDRGVDYSSLVTFFISGKVPNLIGLPGTGHSMLHKIAGSLELAGVHSYKVSNMEEAVQLAYQITNSNQICLLSPAAASYGYYKNFEERGDLFEALVHQLDIDSKSSRDKSL